MAEFFLRRGDWPRPCGRLRRAVVAIGLASRERSRPVLNDHRSIGPRHRTDHGIPERTALGRVAIADEPRRNDPQNFTTRFRLLERCDRRLDSVADRHVTGRVRSLVGGCVESAFLVVPAFPRNLASIGSLSADPVRRTDRDDGRLHQGRSRGIPLGRDTRGNDHRSQADGESLRRTGQLERAGDRWSRRGGFVWPVVPRSFFWPALDRLCAGHAAVATFVLGDRDAATAAPEAVVFGIAPVGAGRDTAAGRARCGEA